jgi:peptidoglycan/xylan/chitin deacetylase (PgdA/CDA1 family)
MSASETPAALTILMYHAVVRKPLPIPDWCFVSEDTFRDQMEAVAATGRACALSDAVERLIAGSGDEPAIAVTFDDGFLNNCTVAFPVLQHFEIPATIFVNTAFVDTPDCVWFCKVNRAVAETRLQALAWRGESYDLSSTEARSAASARMQARLKEHPHPDLLRALADLCRDLGHDAGEPVTPESPYAVLDGESMHRMSASGLVDFGGHTHTHAILSQLSREQSQFEILTSVAGVGEFNTRPVKVFAYPNGRRQDYNAESIEILRAAGIHAAVTAIHGSNLQSTPLMELRRFGIGADTTAAEFQDWLGHGRQQ